MYEIKLITDILNLSINLFHAKEGQFKKLTVTRIFFYYTLEKILFLLKIFQS